MLSFVPRRPATYSRPCSCARVHALTFGSKAYMKATFKCSGRAALRSFESMPCARSSGSVLTSIGSASVRAFMSGQSAAMVFVSSGCVRPFMSAKGYT